MRYRLDVVASGVLDVVRFAGGWLFGYGWFAVAAAVKRASRPPSR